MNNIFKRIFGTKKKDEKKLDETGYRALKIVSDTLTRLGYKHHVDFGTLLGQIREGGFISHDLDIDFSVYEDCDFIVLKQALQAEGLKFVHGFLYEGHVTEITMTYKHITIDFFKCFCGDEEQYYFLYGRFDKSFRYPHGTKQAVKCITPKVTGTKKEKFAGQVDISVPINAEDLLEREYGADWRVPNPNWSINLSDEHLRVMSVLGRKIKKLSGQ